MSTQLIDVSGLTVVLQDFAAERDWTRFHSPKNLVMALSVEVAELVELFQWRTEDESRAARGDANLRQALTDEVADVLIYLTELADTLGIDMNDAVVQKLAKNALKYPVPVGRKKATQRHR